jgi:hypothetical protein
MNLRAVFFEEADARAVAVRLLGDGFDAEVLRERFAGEDDDEDHAWAVRTDAPDLVVELLVEQYDGWLDVEEPAPPRVAPPDLPTQPRL